MIDTKTQGQVAEHNARQFLEQHGLTFVEQNVRYRFGEIDLVMKDYRYKLKYPTTRLADSCWCENGRQACSFCATPGTLLRSRAK